jgi:hypothetical protein
MQSFGGDMSVHLSESPVVEGGVGYTKRKLISTPLLPQLFQGYLELVE